MGHRATVWAFGAFLLVGLSIATEARAELWAVRAGPAPRVVAREVVIVAERGRQMTQETLILTDVEGRFARFVPMRRRATYPDPVEGLEAATAEATARRTPARIRVRDDPFGPSYVARWYGPSETPPAAPHPEPSPLATIGRASFQGSVSTSTVTKQVVLPLALEGFVNRYQLRLDRGVAAAIGKYLNEGWVVVGTVYETARGATHHRLGPVRTDRESEAPRLALPASTPDPVIDLFVVAEGPLVPTVLPFEWSETPWDLDLPEPGRARAYGREVWSVDERGVAPWIGAGVATNRAVDDVVHLRVRPGREPYRELKLGPAGDVPQRPERGTPFDLFMAIVLGAIPVYAAPESWVLFWVQRTARARARPTNVSWLTRVWPVWPAVVGVYWLLSEDPLVRWSATVPLLLALLIFRPYAPEPSRFVRARFEKRKKA